MAVKLSFKGVGSGASENEAQKETAEKIEALQAQKRQPLGGKKWNLHISQCGIRTPIVVPSIASSANKENELFLLAGIFTSASISQNSSTTSQQDGEGMQRQWANLKTVDEAAASDVESELRLPLDATATTVHRPDVQDLIARTLRNDGKALASIRPNTKLIWIETPTNTSLRLSPIAHITSLIYSLPATSRPLIVIDSTFVSLFYISPLAAPISADLAIHSITKYINRHSDVLMGAVILPNASTAEANGNMRRKYPPLSSFLITVLFRLWHRKSLPNATTPPSSFSFH
ncbi:hypothetical protein M422DRAFT_264114 [Sphaerobolus stellatus SS14]|uniref:cystathionine gamma-lyase n=1 Tax=Sphaerobolus stellatus (strain SS14) TaxID=990650 RepID=A0A0C9UGC1_SPHS4|nr:hypothetical protein M422DRAFT_264114 [Sphaerobolus stellatus SS14]